MESWFESDEYPTTPRLQSDSSGLQQSKAHTFHLLPLAEHQVCPPRADTRTAVDDQIPKKAKSKLCDLCRQGSAWMHSPETNVTSVMGCPTEKYGSCLLASGPHLKVLGASGLAAQRGSRRERAVGDTRRSCSSLSSAFASGSTVPPQCSGLQEAAALMVPGNCEGLLVPSWFCL